MSRLLAVLMLVPCLSLVGCSSNPADPLLKEKVGVLDEIAGILDSSKDVKDCKSKIDVLGKKVGDLNGQLQKLSKDQQEKALVKFGPELKKATEHIGESLAKLVKSDPTALMELPKLLDLAK